MKILVDANLLIYAVNADLPSEGAGGGEWNGWQPHDDAHIAALAIEHGCSVCSADNDFKRFTGIRHINPLAS